MRKDFALCCDQQYVPFASVTISSILDKMNKEDEVHIHVLGNGLTQSNINQLLSLGSQVALYDISYELNKLELSTTSEWSISTWGRMFLPEILDSKITSVLYLDCDVIVNDSLDKLFSLEMSSFSIAGCIDPQTYDSETYKRLNYSPDLGYICAGIMLINLDYWRGHNISHKILEYGITNSLKFLDQDAINYICRDTKKILTPDYGVMVPFFLREDFKREHAGIMENLFYSPKIIHYAGYQPWNYAKNKSPHSYLWWKYYKKLNMFPHIRKEYIKSMIKWYVRVLLSKTRLITKENKYSIYQYYYHKRISHKNLN